MNRPIRSCFTHSIVMLGGTVLALSLLAGCGPDAADSRVYVNGVALSEDTLQKLEQQYRVQARPGRYWYDNMCGAVGFEGQGTAGFLPAGLDLGGPLRADASKGSSGVFVNGRELTPQEVAVLRQVTQVQPGRYWLDSRGNAGVEGGPTLCNLVQLSQRAPASHSWRSNTTGIGVVGQGNFVGVMGEGWSVTVGN